MAVLVKLVYVLDMFMGFSDIAIVGVCLFVKEYEHGSERCIGIA